MYTDEDEAIVRELEELVVGFAATDDTMGKLDGHNQSGPPAWAEKELHK